MTKPVIYVVVNKALNMTPGKMAAQVGHAVAGLMGQAPVDDGGAWLDFDQRWLIVLQADNGEQIINLSGYLRERMVTHFCVVDEGVNEIPPFSLTALAAGILDKDGPDAALLAPLKLYRHPKPAPPTFRQWFKYWWCN